MKKLMVVFGLLFFLTGCMMINEQMLRKVNMFPPQKQEMTVEVKTGKLIQKLNGEGQNRGVFSGTTVLNSVAKSIMTRWKEKNIIADYAFPGELKKEPDYTITLSGERNEDGSMLAALLGGLTLGILPSSVTLTYELDFEFINNHTQKHYNVKVKNAVTTISQIFLIVALPVSMTGATDAINDMADNLYDELNKQGAF